MNRRNFIKVCLYSGASLLLPNSAIWNTKKNVIENIEKTINLRNEINLNQQLISSIKISDLQNSPLEMNWIYAKNDLRQFFWLNQFEVIFENYNEDIIEKDENWNLLTSKKLYLEKEFVFPNIFDSLNIEFPDNLSDFLKKYPEYTKEIWDSITFVIIRKLDNWKFAMAYYKEEKLFLATHVSPWVKSRPKNKEKKDKVTWETKIVTIPWWNNSPKWVFYINKDEQFKFKKSFKFESSPMPYAIQIYKWIFLHHGQDVDWQKRSHWCIRVPGFYQKLLYDNIDSWTKIIICWTN